MKTPEKTLHFLVLVPHRDCLPSLEAYRRVLFSRGFNGAFSFPAVAPLALLDRPLGSGLVKAAAAELREGLGDKKVTPQGLELCPAWGIFRFSGPGLDLPLISIPAPAGSEFPVVLQRWEKPLLAPVLLAHGSDGNPFSDPVAGPMPRFVSFRAMALANLALNQHVETVQDCDSFDADFSFTWELGQLHWLPSPRLL
jgi:hypothetical protein